MIDSANIIDMGHLKDVSYKEIWFLLYRPQISLLMSGSVDNHLAALMLMWPCMERAFTLHKPEFDSVQNGGNIIPVTDKVLRWFLTHPDLSEEQERLHEKVITILHKSLVNGLKHDSFMRHGVELEEMIWVPVEFPEAGRGRTTIGYQYVYRVAVDLDGDYVIIGPTNFWGLVRDKIDTFYIDEYEQ